MRASPRLFGGLAAIGTAALLACESRAAPRSPAAPPPGRDSAGVAVVSDTSPIWAAGAGWRVADSPLVVLGGDAIEPAYSFAGIRGGILREDGGFVVGNAAPASFRIYDAGGNIRQTVSQPGSRPGEFARVGWLRRFRGDSILVYDNADATILVFDAEGRYGRQLTLRSSDPGVIPLPVAAFADGSFLTYERPVIPPDSIRDGIYQDSLRYFRREADGRIADTLGWFPGDQFFVGRPGGSLALVPLPFGRTTTILPGRGRFHVATGEGYEIRSYDEHGRLVRIVRQPRMGDSVTAASIAAVRGDRLADAARKGPVVNRALTTLYASIPWPAREPPISDLLLDHEGNLWAREHETPGPERWAVFDSAGRLLGRLRTPAGLTLLDIGPDRILGSRTDAGGRDFVEVYRLNRGQ